MVEKKPLEGVPVSRKWLSELLALGREGGGLPPLKQAVESSELLGFLGRRDVAAALKLPQEDVDFTRALVDLGDEHRRRFGITLDPQAYNAALAVKLEGMAGLSLRPCGMIKDLPEHHLRHHLGKQVDALSLDECERVLFADDVGRPGWRAYYGQRVNKVAGACVDGSGSRFLVVGRTLELVEDVGFFHVRAGDEFAACQLSALRNDPARGVLMPMVGDFMDDGGPIPDGKLKKWGIERLRDGRGNPVRYPMFAHTGRSLMEFCSTSVYVAAVDGKVRLINRPEAAVDILKEVCGEPLAELARRKAEMTVQERFREEAPGIGFAEYRSSQLGKALYDVGMGMLQQFPHPEIRRRVRVGRIPVCAIQYKGVGGKYDGHYVSLPEEEVLRNPKLRFLWTAEGGDSFVLDRRFEGRRGMPLTVAYQEGSRDPPGATATLESLGYDREQRILDHGGFLSGITVGIIKLFDRGQVPNMPVKEVGVAVVAIIDDTRRIGEFLAKEGEGRSRDYMAFVVEKYKPPETLPESGLDGYIEQNFEECRHLHLSEFFGKLGNTMRGVLESGLTNPRDQNLMENLSVCGGITDTRALADMTDHNMAAGLIRGVVYHLNALGRAAGYQRGEIFRTEYFARMAAQFLGPGAESVLDYVNGSRFRTGEGYDNLVQSTKVVGLLTDAWVRGMGQEPSGAYHTSDAEFLKMLKADPAARERAHMPEDALEVYSSVLGQPEPAVKRGDMGVIPLEEALEVHRAALEDRMDRTPSIYENARAIERKMWGQN